MTTTSTHHCTSVPCPLCCGPSRTAPIFPQQVLTPVAPDTIVMRRLVPDGMGGYVEIERVEVIR